MTNHQTTSPTSRLEGARKQLRLALQQVDDPSVAARIRDARRAARRASDALVSAPITADPVPEDTVGERLVECVACGLVGLPERIHRLGCPHNGDCEGGGMSVPTDECGRTSKGIAADEEVSE